MENKKNPGNSSETAEQLETDASFEWRKGGCVTPLCDWKKASEDFVCTLVGEAPLFSHRLLLLVTSTGFRSCQRHTQAGSDQHWLQLTAK